MSDAFHGADVAALRQQAVSLHGATEVLVACVQRTTHALDALAWRGQDAERIRTEWRTQHAPALLRVGTALNGAALHLLEEAERQEAASAATGTGVAAPAAAPGGGTWSELRGKVDKVHGVLSDAVRQLSYATNTANVAAAATALNRWDNVTLASSYKVLDQAMGVVQDAHIGPAVGTVLKGATVIGVANSTYGVYDGYTKGDLYRTVDNAVYAVTGAASLAPPVALAATAVSGSWQLGTWVGEGINAGMEGTAFGERFTQRMDASFDVAGAWGMVATPGALIVTAAEEVAIRTEAAWQGLTGSADGTLDGPR